MGFKDDVRAEQNGRGPGTKCGVAAWLAVVGEKVAEEAMEALDDESLTHSSIARVIGTYGGQVSQYAVGRHRRGDCSCGKPVVYGRR